jgi:hypothetical protein
MDYQKIYNSLIERSKNRLLEGYSEKHHIVPRCLGGTNEEENITRLTAEEHYLAHQLLVKLFPKNVHLVSAAMAMTKHSTSNRMNNKLFGWLRKRASELTIGIPKSEMTKQKMRKPKSDTHSKNISLAQLKNGGNGPKKHSVKTKSKIQKWTSENTAFKIKLICPHCNLSGGKGPMIRFHFDNCKHKGNT